MRWLRWIVLRRSDSAGAKSLKVLFYAYVCLITLQGFGVVDKIPLPPLSAQPAPTAGTIKVSPLSGTPAENGDAACVGRALAAPFRVEHYILNRVEFHGSGPLESATYECAARQDNEMLRIRAKPSREGLEAVAAAAGSAAAMFGGDAVAVAVAMRTCATKSTGRDGEAWKWESAGAAAVSCAITNGLFVGRVSVAASAPKTDAAKVAACLAVGDAIAKATGTTQKDVNQSSTRAQYLYSGRCTAIDFVCKTRPGAPPSIDGHVTLLCDASPARFVTAVRAIVPVVPAETIRPFAAACIAARSGGRGPKDIEIGRHLLTCDHGNPNGVTVAVERMLD